MKASKAALSVAALSVASIGAFVVASPTTAAKWSTSFTGGGGIVRSGDLNIATVGTTTWANLTRVGDTTLMPGDSVRGTQPLDIAIEGTNTTSDTLTINYLDSSNAPASLPAGVTATCWLETPAGVALTAQSNCIGFTSTILKSSVNPTLDGVADVVVKSTVTYPAGTTAVTPLSNGFAARLSQNPRT